MLSARKIIDLFGYASLATALDVPTGTVSAWKTRNGIPHQYWREIEAAALSRGISDVTYAALEAAAPARRHRKLLPGLEEEERAR